jgi:hypothetical protein
MNRRLSGRRLVAGARSTLEGGEPTLHLFSADLDAIVSSHSQGAAMFIVHDKSPLASQASIHVALRFEKPWTLTHDPDRKVVPLAIVVLVQHAIRSHRWWRSLGVKSHRWLRASGVPFVQADFL